MSAPPTLGILAGGGPIPGQVAAAARAAGRDVFIVGLEGFAETAVIAPYKHLEILAFYESHLYERPHACWQPADRDKMGEGRITRYFFVMDDGPPEKGLSCPANDYKVCFLVIFHDLSLEALSGPPKAQKFWPSTVVLYHRFSIYDGEIF